MSKKKKAISGVLATVLKLVVNTLKKKIEDIKAEGLKPLLNNIAGSLNRIIDVLSDDDPENAEQLKEIQKDAIAENVASYHVYVNDNLLNKIENESLRGGASVLLNSAKDVTLALTDDNPDNNEQLKIILEEYDVPLASNAKAIIIDKLSQYPENDTAQLAIEVLRLIDEEGLLDPVE